LEVVENRRQVRHEYQTTRAPEGSIKGAKIQTILGFARASSDDKKMAARFRAAI
jgi:hypothetical protein